MLGIRTTIPFFLWLMREPDFLAGRFDTTYLDRLLASRRGESFSEFTDAEEQQIAIAAALDAWFRASARPPRRRGRERRQARGSSAARQEALRAMTFEIESTAARRTVSIERAGARPLPRDRRRRRRDRRRAAQRRRRALAALARRRRTRASTIQFAPGQAPGELLAYLGGRHRRRRRQRPPHRPRRRRQRRRPRTANRRSSRRCPGASSACSSRAGDEVERAPARRGRRGDEDGERAALAEGRTGQGRRRDARHVRRGRPRAGGDRVSQRRDRR